MHRGSELKPPARKRNGRLMQTSEKVCGIEMEETTGERSAKGSAGEYSIAVPGPWPVLKGAEWSSSNNHCARERRVTFGSPHSPFALPICIRKARFIRGTDDGPHRILRSNIACSAWCGRHLQQAHLIFRYNPLAVQILHEIKVGTGVRQGMPSLKVFLGNVVEQNLPCYPWLTFCNCEFTGRTSSISGRWACFEVAQDVDFPLPNIMKP